MNRTLHFETPWVLVPATVVVWAVVWIAFEVAFFGGDAFDAAVRGAAGGFVFALVRYYVKQRRD